jgi:concanavalin A-like lectin/glucanase superfamily protein/uncharacterized protein DUF2341
MRAKWMQGVVLGLAAFAWGADDYPSWTYSRDLLIDASPAGAAIASNLAGFPLSLILGSESAELFAQAKPDGSDLRFAAEDGSHLAYQIESWDPSASKAAIWVRLPSVKGGQTTRVRVHWGKASAVDSSSGPAVFRAEDGFQGVWHMGSMADASSNAASAQDSGTTADAAGRIGAARAFKNDSAYAAKGAYMALGNPAPLNLKGVITLEAWVKWQRRDGHRIILCHGSAPGSQFETVLRIGETLDYRAGTWTGSGHYAASVVPPSDSGTWVHLAGVFDGTGWILYRNGAKLAALAADTNGAKPSPGAWRIGAEYTSTGVTRYFSGSLDEVRLSSAARGADWFKLAYATQKDGQTAVKWAAATALGQPAPVGRKRIGASKAGRWPAPKAGKAGYIDASGSFVP